MDKPGYLYILKNASFAADVYKLGMTKNPKQRLRSYVTCFVDKSDFMYISSLFHDCYKAEQVLFHLLRANWLRDNREFFKVPFEQAKSCIHDLEQKSMDELNDLYASLRSGKRALNSQDTDSHDPSALSDDEDRPDRTNLVEFLNSFKFNPGLNAIVKKYAKITL